MTRVFVVVEGQTEESFVKNVLAPSLYAQELYLIPLLLGKPGKQGGKVSFQRVKQDVVIQLKQDQTAYCSTMLDLYGLRNDFPGMPYPANASGLQKAIRIENGLLEAITVEAGHFRPDLRFLPYVQIHEFEGLLFSDPIKFALALGRESLSASLVAIRGDFDTPEDINDDPDTAPSKRLLKLYPQYQKVNEGTTAASMVGVQRMRQECPHFNEWVTRLEELPPL